MKVLLINNFHYRKGGSEAVYFNTAEALKSNAHQVIFFSRTDELNLPCEQSGYFIRDNKVIVYPQRVANYFHNREAARLLEKLILHERPDIAHAHLFWGGISPSIFSVLRKYGIPLVHTAHDYRMVCPAYAFKSGGKICEACCGKYFYRCALKRCSKGSLIESMLMSMEMYVRNRFFNPAENLSGIIYVSRFSRDKHVEYLPALSSVPSTVLYNASPEAPAELLNRYKRGYYIFFGRLSYEKGVDRLIDVFCSLPDLRLKIVGTGPLEDELKRVAAERQASNIEFSGYKTGLELQRIISDASFVLVPSQCYENNPLTVIEAYSLQKPVIGARLGGIPEIVDDADTGFLFRHDDPGELRDTILKSARLSDQEYRRMAQNDLRFYRNHFDPQKYGFALEKFYNQILHTHETV